MRIHNLEPVNRKVIIAKLGFLTALVALGFIVSAFVKKPTHIAKKPSVNATDAAGVVKGIIDEIDVQPLITTTETVKKQLAAETALFIQEQASDAGAFVSDLVYDRALKPIVDQIDKLPQNQQVRLREQLCR